MKYSLTLWLMIIVIATILCRLFPWLEYNFATLLIFLYVLSRICKYLVFRHTPTTWRLENEQTVIVTGSGSGIGCQIAQQLSERGGKVIWAARDIVKAKRIFDDIVWTPNHGPRGYLLHMDLASKASIENFVQRFKSMDQKLNLLVLNAAYHGPHRLTEDGFEQNIGVNHLGHMYLCYLLIDVLKASAPSRVVVVASDLHKMTKAVRLDDLMYKNCKDYSAWGAYNHSKLLNILFVLELSRRLTGTGITVHAAHPGTPVLTELLRENRLMNQILNECFFRPLSFLFCRSTLEAAQTPLYCALAPQCGVTSGKYFENCREASPSNVACDAEAGRHLWDISCDLLNIETDWL